MPRGIAFGNILDHRCFGFVRTSHQVIHLLFPPFVRARLFGFIPIRIVTATTHGLPFYLTTKKEKARVGALAFYNLTIDDDFV
jgi:hypothetical protein